MMTMIIKRKRVLCVLFVLFVCLRESSWISCWPSNCVIRLARSQIDAIRLNNKQLELLPFDFSKLLKLDSLLKYKVDHKERN